MWNWFKNILKDWVAKEELARLRRFESAAALAYRWNGQLPNSAQTALWIQMVGQGTVGQDIDGFREALKLGQGDEYLARAAQINDNYRFPSGGKTA